MGLVVVMRFVVNPSSNLNLTHESKIIWIGVRLSLRRIQLSSCGLCIGDTGATKHNDGGRDAVILKTFAPSTKALPGVPIA